MPFYLTDASQISSEEIENAIGVFRNYFNEHVLEKWNASQRLEDIEYYGSYFLNAKGKNELGAYLDANYNYFYMIFKIKVLHPSIQEPMEFYTYMYMPDLYFDGVRCITRDSEGTGWTWYVPYTGLGSDEYFYVDNYRYYGYQTVEELCQRQIESKSNRFEYVFSKNE